MDKKKKILLVLITILIVTICGTFAYFMAQTGDGASANANIKTSSVDDLKFSVSNDLSIVANQFNFAKGEGNLESSATARASLKANNSKNTATYNYYVYFQIESNSYIYTTTGKLPEVVLSITSPNGEVTSVDGLTYVSATNADGTIVKGFDITNLSSTVIKIADNYEITSNSSTNYTNQDWTFKVTFINLDSDQTDNEGKSMVGKVLIQKEKINSLSDYVISQYTGTQGENGLYYHDSSLANGAGDNSYRYAGASDVVNNYVCFGSDESTCPDDNLYRIIGVFDGRAKIIKADYETSTLLGTDGDYGGTYASSTTGYKGNLSISDIGGYVWNYYGLLDHTGDNQYGSNTWSTSLLNKTNLNTNYLNNIGSKWADIIDTTSWKVGGNTYANIAQSIPSVAYQNEIVNPTTSTTYEAKVGLMYASDYGFAADPSAWTTILNHYSNYISKNWMYMGLVEYTIFRNTDYSSNVFYVLNDGQVNYTFASVNSAVRPVFYLSSSVKFSSGDGTKSSPYRIEV